MDESTVRTWAQLLRVMAHPTRLQILRELARGTKCVTNICCLLDMAQPNVSQHLALLKQSGLVACQKQGVMRCYELTRPGLVRALLALLEAEVDGSDVDSGKPIEPTRGIEAGVH